MIRLIHASSNLANRYGNQLIYPISLQEMFGNNPEMSITTQEISETIKLWIGKGK